jgi:signal transduction histidine kinase
VAVEAWSPTEALTAAQDIGIDASAALLAPLDFRGSTLGAIVALDRLEEGPRFSPEDERMLAAAATSAAAAVATVQSVTEERLRQNLMAAERERARWARELHDTVLQGMGARRLLLTSVLKSGDPEGLKSAVEEGLRDVGRDIDELRRLITELRPATLDQLGLVAALEDLVERIRHSAGVELATDLRIDAAHLDPELETVVYRLVQEALTNVAKHAAASSAELRICGEEGRLDVLVADDGRGFDPTREYSGFGLTGMRERVELAGGELRIESKPGAGARVMASLPLAPTTSGSGLDKAPG